MKTLVFVLGVLFVSSTYGIKYQDPELEAIVIDDSISEPLDPELFEPVEESTTLAGEGYCSTSAGIPGRCVPSEICYPYFQYLTADDKEKDYTTGLVEIVLNGSEPCQNEGGDSSSKLICCPNYSYGLPNKKPGFLPQFARPNTTAPDANPNTKVKTCGTFAFNGLDNEGNRVVGGRLATKGEFPWAVALLNNGRQFCGGSLIDSNWVLTAAHCVQGMTNTAGMRINIGDHDLSTTSDGPHETRGASKVLYHKDFAMNHLRNDIALIKLSSPVAFSKTITPVCLNSGPVPYDKKADLAGWGKVSNNGPPSNILRTVNMRVIPVAECQALYRGTGAPSITTNMVCAGEKQAGKDACNGDSGGPLTYAAPLDSTARQIGVVSFGIGCGDKPGVYTSVVKYLDWIERNAN